MMLQFFLNMPFSIRVTVVVVAEVFLRFPSNIMPYNVYECNLFSYFSNRRVNNHSKNSTVLLKVKALTKYFQVCTEHTSTLHSKNQKRDNKY